MRPRKLTLDRGAISFSYTYSTRPLLEMDLFKALSKCQGQGLPFDLLPPVPFDDFLPKRLLLVNLNSIKPIFNPPPPRP